MVDLGQVNIVFDNPTLQLKLVDGEYSFYHTSASRRDNFFLILSTLQMVTTYLFDEIYSDLTG